MKDLEDFLSHYGVKGMKWGVRRRRGSRVQPSEDAKRASDIRAKAKTGTVKSLSNQEIRDFTTRVQLEASFKNATPTPARKTLNFVKNILGYGKTVNEVATFANSPAGQQLRSGMQKSSTKIKSNKEK